MKVVSAEAAAAFEEPLSARFDPIMVQGCATSWPAMERWASPEQLCTHYGGLEFELANDVRMTLREYTRYATENESDAPFYLVERRFNGASAALLDDFSVPSLFEDDLLAKIPGSRRARYWFVGGTRTGTFLHVDPLCTSAWNVCVGGAKRWCFLAPETDLKPWGLEHFEQGKQQRAADWFVCEMCGLLCDD